MTINETLPFEHCQRCPEFILDVDMNTLYGDDKIVGRCLDVSCKHRWLCTQIAERIKADGRKDSTGQSV